MRIISSFHDYYDCMMDASDKENLFIRKTQIIELDKRRYNPYLYEYTVREIGFCGQIYSYYFFQDKIYWQWNKLKPVYEEYLRKINNWKTKNYFRKRYNKYKKKQEPNNIHIQQLKSYFRKYNTPYFHYRSGEIIINPCLADYEFYKIKPPPQCYQEIEQFYFGVIAERREHVPEVSDKDLIIAKGFDLKSSFRKEKKNK